MAVRSADLPFASVALLLIIASPPAEARRSDVGQKVARELHIDRGSIRKAMDGKARAIEAVSGVERTMPSGALTLAIVR